MPLLPATTSPCSRDSSMSTIRSKAKSTSRRVERTTLGLHLSPRESTTRSSASTFFERLAFASIRLSSGGSSSHRTLRDAQSAPSRRSDCSTPRTSSATPRIEASPSSPTGSAYARFTTVPSTGGSSGSRRTTRFTSHAICSMTTMDPCWSCSRDFTAGQFWFPSEDHTDPTGSCSHSGSSDSRPPHRR